MASLGGSEQLRQQLLTILQETDQPLTTAELRDHIHRDVSRNVVIEAVYRNLTVLERRGEAERRPGPGRAAYWGATVSWRPEQIRRA